MVNKKQTSKIIQETGLVTPKIELPKRSFVTVQSIKDHSFLIGLKDMIPEDILWRKTHPKLPSLICFDEDHSCACTWACVQKFVLRCVWLFRQFPALQQILVLFNREEKDLKRYIPTSPRTLGRDLQEVVFDERVPRVKILHVPRDFGTAPRPYRIFPANYNGLQIVLSSAIKKEISVPISFW